MKKQKRDNSNSSSKSNSGSQPKLSPENMMRSFTVAKNWKKWS